MSSSFVAMAGVALVLAGCSADESAAPGSVPSIRVGTALAQDQALARALDDEPRSLDPLLQNDVPGQRVIDDLFEGLTTMDVAGGVTGGVASSWERSTDGKTWTFHLRPEARWSNGAPVTAADFIYAWRREVDPKNGSQYAQALAPIEHALEIALGKAAPETLGAEAIDARTLRVHLVNPTPYLLDLMAQDYLYPVYSQAIERYHDDWVRPEHLVCNGAFVLREHVIASHLTLEKNPLYWDAAHVRLQRVTYYVVPDPQVQATRFMANSVQWTDSFSSEQHDYLVRRLGSQVVTSPYYGNFYVTFDVNLPPFKDNWALRQALILAVDREPLVHYMRNGMYQAAYTIMPPLPGYELPVPDWSRLTDEQRHALALRLYHQAGYSAAHPLRAELDIPVSGADPRHFFEAVAAGWRSLLGADIRVDEREFKVLLQDTALHKLPLFYSSWIGDYPDPYTFMQLFTTGDGNNNGEFSDPKYDRLIDAANQQPDNAVRYRIFEQAEQLLNRQAAYLPLYYYATRHLVKPYLRGWQSNIMDRNLSRYMYLLEHQGILKVLRYLVRRLLGAIPTLLLIATLSFLLLHAAPGGPFDSQKRMLPEIQHAIEARFHLNEPLWRQYLRYLSNLAHGDLGPSFQYRSISVNQIIAQGVPVDATVGLTALGLALLAGGAIGVYAALHRNTRWDHAPMALAMVGISLPSFVIAPLLILIFAVQLHWLPPGDWVSGSLPHLILPAVALSLPYTAYVARMMRASTLEVLNSPFMRTAYAKGLPTRLILWRHALRPTLTPLVSFLGPAIVGLVTGSIVVESVFGLPGIGRYFITAALNRDYTLVMGITVLYGTLIIVFNLLADLCYAWIDPRVRLQ